MMIVRGPYFGFSLPVGVCGVIALSLFVGQLMELPGFEHPSVRLGKALCA
jgi:hypothetical protein